MKSDVGVWTSIPWIQIYWHQALMIPEVTYPSLKCLPDLDISFCPTYVTAYVTWKFFRFNSKIFYEHFKIKELVN